MVVIEVFVFRKTSGNPPQCLTMLCCEGLVHEAAVTVKWDCVPGGGGGGGVCVNQ